MQYGEFKFQFVALLHEVKENMSLRASAHTGVAIPWISRELMMEKCAQLSRTSPIFRIDTALHRHMRSPHQRARWFAMT